MAEETIFRLSGADKKAIKVSAIFKLAKAGVPPAMPGRHPKFDL